MSSVFNPDCIIHPTHSQGGLNKPGSVVMREVHNVLVIDMIIKVNQGAPNLTTDTIRCRWHWLLQCLNLLKRVKINSMAVPSSFGGSKRFLSIVKSYAKKHNIIVYIVDGPGMFRPASP